jgi:hypothetical protein
MVGEIWLRNLSCPVHEFLRDIHITVHVEKVVVPNNAVKLEWVCRLCSPDEIEHRPLHDSVVSKGNVAVPVHGFAGFVVDIVVCVSRVTDLVHIV